MFPGAHGSCTDARYVLNPTFDARVKTEKSRPANDTVGRIVGLGLGAGVELGLGIGVELGLGIGVELGLGTGVGLCVGIDVELGLGTGVELGLGARVELGLGTGVELGLGAGDADVRALIPTRTDADSGAACAVSVPNASSCAKSPILVNRGSNSGNPSSCHDTTYDPSIPLIAFCPTSAQLTPGKCVKPRVCGSDVIPFSTR